MEGIRYTPELVKYYMEKGWWTNETWYSIYDLNARGYPDRIAFVDGKRAVTWKELKTLTDRFALKLLELGFQKDDVIISQLPNQIENVVVKIGAEKAGVIFCFAAMNLREVELDYFLQATKAKAIVGLKSYHDFDHFGLYRSLKDSGKYPDLQFIFLVGDGDDGALSLSKIIEERLEEKYPADYLEGKGLKSWEISHLASTSGSTGIPKLVQCCANNLRVHGKAYISRWGVSLTDKALITGVLWTGPVMPALYTLPQVGGTVLMMDTFDVEKALRWVQEERVTFITGLPAHLIRLARHPNIGDFDLSSLRFVSFAGAPFPAGVAHEVEEKLKCKILCFYGNMDAHNVFTVEPTASFERRVYRVGMVPPWDEMKIVDAEGNPVDKGEVGILHWRGPSGSGGIHGSKERTLEGWGKLGLEGWFNTNDRAKLTEDNDVLLMGRQDDVIIRGGYTIYPIEAENKLSAHPKIDAVQVVAMPDMELGEKACAFVILKEGESFSFEEMIGYLTESGLAKFKFPERLEIVDEFPTVRDKVNKRALSGIIARKLHEEGAIDEQTLERWLKSGKAV